MAKPNFFIVGTPKSGTTSLFNYLEEHPEIFVPTIKEPHFFSHPEVASTYYKTTLIGEMDKYNALYEDGKGYKVIGDFSSSYLFNERSAAKIKSFNPEAKIIVILRNPTKRAVSHYMMDYSQGYINATLMEVITNKKKHPDFYKQYMEIGFYESQLTQYYKEFPKKQVLVLLSDQLFSETEKTVTEIFDFLGVNASFKPDYDKIYNQFKEPRFKAIRKLKNSRMVKWVFDRLPGRLKNIATKVAFDENKEKPNFDKEEAFLNNLYLNDIIKTEQLLGKDLSFWKNNAPTI